MHLLPVIAATDLSTTSQNMVSAITSFASPIILAIVGFLALKFLLNRQITQFIMFLILAILVSLIFFYPAIVYSFATQLKVAFGISSSIPK